MVSDINGKWGYIVDESNRTFLGIIQKKLHGWLIERDGQRPFISDYNVKEIHCNGRIYDRNGLEDVGKRYKGSLMY